MTREDTVADDAAYLGFYLIYYSTHEDGGCVSAVRKDAICSIVTLLKLICMARTCSV
jgi:hypothetical protein